VPTEESPATQGGVGNGVVVGRTLQSCSSLGCFLLARAQECTRCGLVVPTHARRWSRRGSATLTRLVLDQPHERSQTHPHPPFLKPVTQQALTMRLTAVTCVSCAL
jgi:hypothetical protein